MRINVNNQRNITPTTVPSNNGSGGVTPGKANFRALLGKFEQPSSGPTTAPLRPRTPPKTEPTPPKTVTTSPTLKQNVFDQRNNGVRLAPRNTSNPTIGTGRVSTRSPNGPNNQVGPKTTPPHSRVNSPPNTPINTPPNTGVGQTNVPPQTGKVVTVVTALKPEPPRQPEVPPKTTPIQSRSVEPQTPAPLDKLKDNVRKINNALRELGDADPATIRRELPKVEQALQQITQHQKSEIPEGAALMRQAGPILEKAISELKAKAEPPVNPKTVAQQSMKDLTNVRFMTTPDGTYYMPVDTKALKANGEQMAAILGKPFTDKLEARYAGETSKQYELSPLYLSSRAATGGATGLSDFIGSAVVKDLAHVLIDDRGRLTGKGMSDLSIDLSHPGIMEHAPLGTLKNADGFIKTLATNPSVREALNNVSAPTSGQGKQLVRATLGLPVTAPVTEVETRRAILTAMLSELRQGTVGSCFATGFCVGLQQSHPEAMINDLAEMLTTGKLVKGGTEALTIAKVNNSSLTDEIRDTDAQKLAIRPDLKAALLTLSIPENQHANRISAALNGMSEPSPKKILEKLVQDTGRSQLQQSALLNYATLSFQGAGQNALSRTFEYTVASLAANVAISQPKRQITEGLFAGFHGIDDSKSASGFLEQHGLHWSSDAYQASERAIKSTAAKQFSYHYDPTIASGNSSDGSSTAGVYTLTHTAGNGTVTVIKNEQDYANALRSSMTEALTGISGQHPEVRGAINALPSAINGIMNETIKAFGQKKPWSVDGGFGKDTLAAYHGLTSASELHHFDVDLGGPTNNRNGLQFTEKLIRGMEQLQTAGQSHVLVGGPGHAFNMLPEHPSLKSLIGNLGSNPGVAITNQLNALRQGGDPTPKIVLCDMNWGDAGSSHCLALAFGSNGTPTLQHYDPHSDTLGPLPNNMQRFVNAGKWSVSELAA